MPISYDFQIRQTILDNARDLELVANNYTNRTYQYPQLIIDNLENEDHKLASTIQFEGGARSEGVTLIKENQLKGSIIDKITNKEVFVIETKEKGGKIGDVYLSKESYEKLENHIKQHGRFKISYGKYAKDIRESCLRLGFVPKGSHGFRWTFAQNRVREYQANGYTYEQALQGVSWEMKHFRASITEHYLG